MKAEAARETKGPVFYFPTFCGKISRIFGIIPEPEVKIFRNSPAKMIKMLSKEREGIKRHSSRNGDNHKGV